MEKPPPNVLQNSIAFKTKDYDPQRAGGISFFAFLFSICIYISIFYIFNLSPSKLLHNNKFWFFISNTLILIIAVDYGSFSSSSRAITKYGIQDEYAMRGQRASCPVSPRTGCIEIPKAQEAEECLENKRNIKHQKSLPLASERVLPPKPLDSSRGKRHEGALESDSEGSYHKEPVSPRALKRSQSEIVKRVVIDESKNIVRRIEAEKYEPPDSAYRETNNEHSKSEYANLSNEELNRRFEDFIRRFNMQIRLQGQMYSKAH